MMQLANRYTTWLANKLIEQYSRTYVYNEVGSSVDRLLSDGYTDAGAQLPPHPETLPVNLPHDTASCAGVGDGGRDL